MNITYEKTSYKGVGLLNEDAVIFRPQANLYGVVDGVSSLVPYRNAKEETGGFIAANLVKTHFESFSVPDSRTLLDRMVEANDRLREQMVLEQIDLEKKAELWGAAAAVVRVQADGVAFIQTGDCMILAVYDDEVRPLTRRQVSQLEAPAFAMWQEGVTGGLKTQKELHDTVIDTARADRA
ncbi:protein phosphatase 2C domain-containing protein [Paenibacillus sacheonensis]|uniref:protein phosphatase 2C domain-containing protein n=1 Tax=Paenibacillus sacheonensis TaxID=742054 RepID=UPI0030845AF8|nr:serine/threonine protein phosphatase PrpC [Paenibacillus sacheonensis]